MIRQWTVTLMLVGMLSACGPKQSPPAPAAPAAVPEPAATSEAPVAAAATVEPFNQSLDLQGITFTVACPNDGARNTVTLTSAGLEADNSAWTQEVEGVVTGAEVGDLNADGSPEVYIYARSSDPDAKGSVLGYAANKRKSLSLVAMPALSDSPDAAKGYRGHDEFAVLENALGRRFPIHDETGAPTGKMRQLQYKLTAGEAGWNLKVDRTTEF